MLDGDLCRRVVTPGAMDYLFRADPRDRFLAGDNYEVNYPAFDTVKKTLIRISRLVSFPADANLWMPIAGHPDKIQVVIRNANKFSQLWPWGALYQDMIPEMKTVLETGRRATVARKPGWISVLAPVSDSPGGRGGGGGGGHAAKTGCSRKRAVLVQVDSLWFAANRPETICALFCAKIR